MSSIHIERGIKDVFETFIKTTRYKEVKTHIFSNGVFRIDIKLLYGLYIRFIIDPLRRVETIYMVGYLKNSKFKAIFHYDFKVDFEKIDDSRKIAKDLEKEFKKLTDEYRYRLNKRE